MDPLPEVEEPHKPSSEPIDQSHEMASLLEPAPRKFQGRDWVTGSIPAVILIIASAVIFQIVRSVIVPQFHLQWMFERPETKIAHGPMLPDPMPQTVPALVSALFLAASLYGGFFVALIACVALCASRPARDKITRVLGSLAVRPLPAIHLFDVLALAALCYIMSILYLIAMHGFVDLKRSDAMKPASMVAFDLAQATAIAVGIAIAWWRARGRHGAFGFWPAWSSAYISPKQPIWKDILLGIIAWPLTLWISSLVSIFNKFLVSDPDRHAMISEFARHPPPLATAIYIIGATFGAAIFEETLFRGILYNSLRRVLGGPIGALLGGFIFAYAHGLKSDLPGLFVLGMVMTWLYDKTGRLVAGMAFHFTNNFVMLVYVLVLYNQ